MPVEESIRRDTSGPLAGLRVVDCSTGFAGLRATWMLADAGADVIWVEPPGGSPFRGSDPPATSVFGRAKRSVTVDLADAGSRAGLEELLAGADVFVEMLDDEAAARVELDWPSVHARHPGLIVGSISGFGPGSRHAHLGAREALVHAVIGTHEEQAGHRDAPIYQGLPFAGIGASCLSALGILAAVWRRELDGVGRHVETSLVDGALAYLSLVWFESDRLLAAGTPMMGPRRRRGTAATRLITRSYVCADDEFIGVHTGAVGAFDRLMTVLGLSDVLPPVAGARSLGGDLTAEQRRVITDEVPKLMASRPRAEWIDVLLAADVCAVEHLRPTGVFATPQAVHNEMTVVVDDPTLGPVVQVAAPAKFAGLAVTPPAPAPVPGQDAPTWRAQRWPRVDGVAAGAPGGAHGGPLLDGLRVLDVGAFFAGPFASRLLADLGADVIKIEPLDGDALRGTGMVFAAQAGKRSLAADLKAPALRPAVHRLVEWADVVHHNLRPGVAERLGLDAASVQAINPRAIYLHACGWGTSGPHALRQSFAPMMAGYTGATFEVAGRYNEPLPPAGNEDPGAGLVSAGAILMALVHRQRTGDALVVESPQLNATMSQLAHIVRTADGEALGAGRLDELQSGVSATDRLYETADGWVCVVADDDDEVAALGAALGVDLTGDPRFATRVDRRDHDDELVSVLAEAFARRDTDEVVARLTAGGVAAARPAGSDAAHSLFRDPEHRRIGRVAELPHPVEGTVREVGLLVRVSDAQPVPHRLFPGLGEHTDEILALAGCDPSEIAAWRQQGIVR